MVTHALYAPLEAKPDKAEELQAFLREAQTLAEQEPGTAAWFALRMGPTTLRRSSTCSPTRRAVRRT